MKKMIFITMTLIMVTGFISCENEESSKKSTLTNVEELNVFRGGQGYRLETKDDFVELIGPSCYLVNIRVYMVDLDTGQSNLVSNQNVQVGSGCGSNRPLNASQTNVCDGGYLPNGDYVVGSSSSNYRYCLLDLLLQHEELYNQYLAIIKEKYSEN